MELYAFVSDHVRECGNGCCAQLSALKDTLQTRMTKAGHPGQEPDNSDTVLWWRAGITDVSCGAQLLALLTCFIG